MIEGKLAKEEIKILEKNRKEDTRKIKEFVYYMNGGPKPILPYKEKIGFWDRLFGRKD